MRILLACVFALLLAGCGGSPSQSGQAPPQPNPGTPAPADPPIVALPARRGLHFGYFGCGDDQPTATADHVTFIMPAWGTDDMLIAQAQASGAPIVLVVEDCLFAGTTPSAYLGDDASSANLRARFAAWRGAGMLARVIALYVCDEPERDKELPDADVRAAVTCLRGVMAEFGELSGSRLWVIFGDQEIYPALDVLDDVGCDAYGQGADILTGQYQRLKPLLRPDQGLLLVPGGASPWQQDPAPFLAYANADAQVRALIAFIYLDHWGGTQNLGIKSNGLLPAYRAAGQAIIAANQEQPT